MAWNDAQYNPWATPIFPTGAAFGTGSPAETTQQPAGLSDFVGGLYSSLGHLAKSALGSSQNALETGNYNPAPALEAAMLPMGTGAIAGVSVKGAEAVLGAGPIRAYHGSPHDFDRFDLSKIGTGEGAQAYGHGLYFAENPEVAKGYRETLTGNKHLDAHDQMTNILQSYKGDYEGALDEIRRRIESANQLPEKYRADMSKTNLPEVVRLLETRAAPKGRMYEVNINADPTHFLDWDKPVSEQSQHIRDVYQNLKGAVDPKESAAKVKSIQENMDGLTADRDPVTNMMRDERQWMRLARERDAAWEDWNAAQSGAKFYESMGRKVPATDTLHGAGIPGIKYLDQGSRTAGQGSSNYVVFNDSLIDILRKYAIPGLMGAPIFANSSEPKS